MLEDNSSRAAAEDNTAEAFTGGYVYLTRIQTSKAVLWYAGKKHRATFDPTYFGSGRVVQFIKKKHGLNALQTEAVGWADTLDELNQLERDVIAWCRAEYGKRCVNSSDGGDGLTSEAAKRILNTPSVKSHHSAAMKAALASPEARARMSAVSKASQARPEVRARMSAAVKLSLACPEVKARHSTAMKAALASPEARARRSAVAKATLARPDVKARLSASIKATLASPEARARMSAASKASQARPEVKARLSAASKASQARPEVKARHSAATKAALSRPEVKIRLSVAQKASKKILTAATAPYRAEWVNILKPALKAAAIEWPKTPHPVAKAETWAAFVETARALLARNKKGR